MTPSLLVDISMIPRQLGGLAAVTKGIGAAFLAFALPYALLESNVRAMGGSDRPGYASMVPRVLMVAVGLIAYNKLFGMLLAASQSLSFAILSEQAWGSFLTQSLRGSDSRFPTLAILFRSVTSIQEIILFLSSLVAVTARDVIVMLQGCFLSLLYAFGPIAVVCGLTPTFSQVTRGWIVNSVQVASWSFILRLVVRVWLELSPLAGSSGQGLADDYLGMLTVNVSFLIMVLGTPVVAARLLSGDNLAAFATTAFASVQTITVARTLKAGQFLNREIGALKNAGPEGRRSFFHHPLGASMSVVYDRVIAPALGRPPEADDSSGQRQRSPRPRGPRPGGRR